MSNPEDTAAAEGRVRAQLTLLAGKFLDRTAVQIALIRAQLELVQAGDPGALRTMRATAHMIHGTGAILGFAALGECAGELEHLSAQIAAEPDTAAEAGRHDSIQKLSRSIEQLAQALVEARRPPGGC